MINYLLDFEFHICPQIPYFANLYILIFLIIPHLMWQWVLTMIQSCVYNQWTEQVVKLLCKDKSLTQWLLKQN